MTFKQCKQINIRHENIDRACICILSNVFIEHVHTHHNSGYNNNESYSIQIS